MKKVPGPIVMWNSTPTNCAIGNFGNAKVKEGHWIFKGSDKRNMERRPVGYKRGSAEHGEANSTFLDTGPRAVTRLETILPADAASGRSIKVLSGDYFWCFDKFS